MIVFLDTSSLFKLYHEESGSEGLLNFLSERKVRIIYLAEIAKSEFTQAIWKKVRTKVISEKQAEVTLSLFKKDLWKYSFVTTDSLVLELAEKLITKYRIEGLRTLDSIQLASSMSLLSKADVFITADKLLNELMIKEGLQIDF